MRDQLDTHYLRGDCKKAEHFILFTALLFLLNLCNFYSKIELNLRIQCVELVMSYLDQDM